MQIAEGAGHVTRLAGIRRARGFTQRELAAASGVSVQAIRHHEQGLRLSPRIDTLKALAGALGVSVDELTDRPGV